MNTTFVKVTVDKDAKTAFICSDDYIVTGPTVKVIIEATPFINAQRLAISASKCKKPGLACADKVIGHARVTGEKTSKNPRFCGLNDNEARTRGLGFDLFGEAARPKASRGSACKIQIGNL